MLVAAIARIIWTQRRFQREDIYFAPRWLRDKKLKTRAILLGYIFDRKLPASRYAELRRPRADARLQMMMICAARASAYHAAAVAAAASLEYYARWAAAFFMAGASPRRRDYADARTRSIERRCFQRQGFIIVEAAIDVVSDVSRLICPLVSVPFGIDE